MTKVTLYDDCAELLAEQSAAVFGNDSDADFHYRLIRESLIFARFLAAEMGIGLCAGWLIPRVSMVSRQTDISHTLVRHVTTAIHSKQTIY